MEKNMVFASQMRSEKRHNMKMGYSLHEGEPPYLIGRRIVTTLICAGGRKILLTRHGVLHGKSRTPQRTDCYGK